MTIEQEIAALLAKAEPLRALPDEEAESAGLPAIVDCINKLRAMEAQAQMDNAEGEFAAIAESLQPPVVLQPVRKPGRPKKVE